MKYGHFVFSLPRICQSGRNLTSQVVGEIKKYFSDKLYKSVIPRAVRLSEAPSFGMPIQYYDKRSKGSDAYNALGKEFLKKNRRG